MFLIKWTCEKIDRFKKGLSQVEGEEISCKSTCIKGELWECGGAILLDDAWYFIWIMYKILFVF